MEAEYSEDNHGRSKEKLSLLHERDCSTPSGRIESYMHAPSVSPRVIEIKAFQALGNTYFLPQSSATSITGGIKHREDTHRKSNEKLPSQKG
ncbi:MAG: hypothetical protein RBS81_10440 [Tenuifilaceae bacterium]|nr:hypothetical protein [Tenuifilaceae bacterium]